MFVWILFVEYQLFRHNTIIFFYDVKDSIDDTNIIWKPKNSSKTIFRLLLREGDQLLLAFWVEMFPISEKVIYFLLLDRKKRKPSYEDDTEVNKHKKRLPHHPLIIIIIIIIIIITLSSSNQLLIKVMVRARCGSSDPPRKRIDHCKMNGVCFR